MYALLKKYICLFIVLAVFSGCEEKKEPVSVPQKVVKTFKVEKKSEVKKSKPFVQSESSGQKAAPVPGEKSSENQKPKDDKVVGNIDKSTKSGLEPVMAINEEVSPVDPLAADTDGSGKWYNPKGRINPFLPIFQSPSEKVVTSANRPKTVRGIRKEKGRLTALEKLDLSQLKLTGILKMPAAQRSIAMVEENTGKGHVVKKGTYMGVNSGRVVEIHSDKVIIEEEVENLMGDIVTRKRELKLQKPLGER